MFVTDLHFSGQRPRWRVGNYFQDLMAKLRDVGAIAKERGVPRVIVGGDITHSPIVSLELGDQIVDEMESWGIPVFVVVGNHDVFANSYDTLHRTWLNHIFRRSNAIRQLDTIYDGDVCIWGVPYDDGIEEELKCSEHATKSSQLFYGPNMLDVDGHETDNSEQVAEKLIEVVHAMVVPGGIHPDARQIDPEDYQTRANLVLSGDYHPGWEGVYERSDLTQFVNPGAMSRRSVSESDALRIPRVVLVDRELNVEFVELPSAKQPEQAFDLDGARKSKEWEHDLDEHVAALQTTETIRRDIRGRIEEIADTEKIDKNIKREALDRYDRHAGDA